MAKGNFGKRNYLVDSYNFLNKRHLLNDKVDAMIGTIVNEYSETPEVLHDVFKLLFNQLRRVIENTEEPYKEMKLNELLDNFKYKDKKSD